MKKNIIFIFGRQIKIVKYFAIIKNVYFNLKKILPLLKSDKLKFIFKIIKGQKYVEFQPNLETEKKYYENKYKFNYEDWFSININIWKKYLLPLNEIKYLEIGCFEGRSAVFVGELENVKELTCVDTFEGNEEHKSMNINFDLVYKNCSENLNRLNKSYKLIKDTSHNFFKNNNKKFNVIYIDGSHFYEDVKKDFLNSINCLDDNGILICDDFLWFFFKKKVQNPIGAILECYEKHRKDLEIIFINHQIIFKKLNSRLHKSSN